jgi:acyl-coenzyme A synthetase/AMP-(fatty) acid ligase
MFLVPADLSGTSSPALYDAAADRTWSYANLPTAMSPIQDALASPRKALVFLFCRNDAATVFAYLSAVEMGHAVALLDERLADEFKTHLIELYEPEFVVSSAAAADPPVGDGVYEWYSPTGGELRVGRRTPASSAIHPNLALLLSTSGSTGTPKFVRLTRANVESNAHSIREALGITAEERPVTSLPIHYSYGLSVLNSHLAAGAEVVISDQGLTAPDFWSAFRTKRCTSWAGVPYSYQILRRLDIDRLDIPSLHTLTQAGGKLHVDLVAHFHDKIAARGGRMFVMYGQTEATARISILPWSLLPEKLGSAGLALPGGKLRVWTGDALTAEPNVTGEVVYSGPNVMMGYATCRADLALGDQLQGDLYTGDTGYLDAGGFLYLTGRRKRDAKVFGLRLNMDEIEDMIRVHGPTAVVSVAEKLIIYCEHGDTAQFATYAKDLSQKLRLHAGAFQFRRIEQLPLNANGKVDYATLEQRQ